MYSFQHYLPAKNVENRWLLWPLELFNLPVLQLFWIDDICDLYQGFEVNAKQLSLNDPASLSMPATTGAPCTPGKKHIRSHWMRKIRMLNRIKSDRVVSR